MTGLTGEQKGEIQKRRMAGPRGRKGTSGVEWSGVEWRGEEWSGGRARMTIAIPRFRVGISLVNGATRKRKHVETKERGRGMQGRG